MTQVLHYATNLQNAEALIFSSHNTRFFLVGISPIAYLIIKNENNNYVYC